MVFGYILITSKLHTETPSNLGDPGEEHFTLFQIIPQVNFTKIINSTASIILMIIKFILHKFIPLKKAHFRSMSLIGTSLSSVIFQCCTCLFYVIEKLICIRFQFFRKFSCLKGLISQLMRFLKMNSLNMNSLLTPF